jgi:hypothetical protein
MRGLVCDDKILGPKTEGKNIQISNDDFDISPIPRSISFPDDDPLTDREQFLLRKYVRNGALYIITPHFVLRAIPKGAVSLAFQRNAKSVQFAFILLAEIPSDPTMQLIHRNKSYAALRRAIASHSYLEIVFACYFQIAYDATSDHQTIHLSGMWEAIKCLRGGSSMVSTEDQSCPVFNLFLSSLTNCVRFFGLKLCSCSASAAWNPLQVENFSRVLRVVYEFLRDWFLESCPFDPCYLRQIVSPAYLLCLEVSFYRHMHPPPFHHPFADDEIQLLREVVEMHAAHELETDVEIHNLHRSFDHTEYRQFPREIQLSPDVSPSAAERALSHFTRNVGLYIVAYDSRRDMGKLLTDCLNLVSVASAVHSSLSNRHRYAVLDAVLDAFFLGGLFLTKSRHPTGTSREFSANNFLANAWIRGKFVDTGGMCLTYLQIRRLQSIFPFLDLADECETVSEVLSLSFQDYTVWQCLMYSDWCDWRYNCVPENVYTALTQLY